MNHPLLNAHRHSQEREGYLYIYRAGIGWQAEAAASAIPASTITSSHIVDATIATADLADESVTSRKLAPTIIRETCTAGGATSSTTETDVTGCTSTFTPAIASVAKVTAYYDLTGDTLADIYQLLLDVDAANEVTLAPFYVDVATHGSMICMGWVLALTAASHTIKMQVKRAVGSGTATFTTNSKLIIEIYGDAGATLS